MFNRATFLAATTAISGAAISWAADPSHVDRLNDRGRIAECVRCDLSGADFRNRLLQLANLIGANLSDAKLDGANMAGVQLNGAKLSRASFVYTNLSGARLDGADLRGADLRNAWLNWTWLTGTDLSGADFTGAKMLGAQLQGADLSKAIGLTSRQLHTACVDAETKLPPGIERPWCPY